MLASLAATLLRTATAAVAASAPPAICSNDTFSIGDRQVVAQFCVPANVPLSADGSARVRVEETLASDGRSVVRATSLDYRDNGGDYSRTIDDIPLAGLGMTGAVHVTIGYRPGTVRLEHALLTPGAHPLK